jgi:hypothetical protein
MQSPRSKFTLLNRWDPLQEGLPRDEDAKTGTYAVINLVQDSTTSTTADPPIVLILRSTPLLHQCPLQKATRKLHETP